MLPRIFPPDNSPESLLKIVVKFIVSNDIPIKYVSLPTEICNTLLEVSVFYHLGQYLVYCGMYLVNMQSV